MHFQFSDSDMDENDSSPKRQNPIFSPSDSDISPSDNNLSPSDQTLSESEVTEDESRSLMTSQSEMSHRNESQNDKMTIDSDYSVDRALDRSNTSQSSRSNQSSSMSHMSDRTLSQSQLSESITENESQHTDFTQT